MGKGERLRKDSQFANVRAQGKTWACESVVLKAIPNGLPWNRYGFVTSKRLGNAVARNRIKRRLREIVRSAPTKDGWDLVFIARYGSRTANYQQLSSSIMNLLHRAHLAADVNEAGRSGRAKW
ncbi:MAG: ribonuclease P protein component [Dehalococcoidia bacterium]|nr:MAG: ribonuclease P protein component [Dehalococcoidia bacterium]